MSLSLCHPPAPLLKTLWSSVPLWVALSELWCTLLFHPILLWRPAGISLVPLPCSSQESSFPHPMPSVFLAVFSLCWLLYEVEIKGEHSLGLYRVGAIPCRLHFAMGAGAGLVKLCSRRPEAETGCCYSAPANWR